jgi:hypothetical protein
MEANIQIVDKLCEEHGVAASPEAKEAIINFAVLFGEKLVRSCVMGRPQNHKISSDDIKGTYEVIKMIHSPEYEADLQEKKNLTIKAVNSIRLFEDDNNNAEEKSENTARTAVTVKLYNAEIYHMSLAKEHQLTYE